MIEGEILCALIDSFIGCFVVQVRMEMDGMVVSDSTDLPLRYRAQGKRELPYSDCRQVHLSPYFT